MPRYSLGTTLALAAALWSSPPCPALGAQDMASGSVFEDGNANGRRDSGEPGIAGVAVSNQLEVVLTDQDGRWRLPVAQETVFFVTQPAGYRVPVDGQNLPRFCTIPGILEVSIGHALIADALRIGLTAAVSAYRAVLEAAGP